MANEVLFMTDNGSAFDGRPGAAPRLNHKDRSARPACGELACPELVEGVELSVAARGHSAAGAPAAERIRVIFSRT